jgi:hypothetical protein
VLRLGVDVRTRVPYKNPNGILDGRGSNTKRTTTQAASSKKGFTQVNVLREKPMKRRSNGQSRTKRTGGPARIVKKIPKKFKACREKHASPAAIRF